jgi:cysteinyl-tRNA synthetase
MPLRLYNTLTRKKEVFKPMKKGKVKMYSCGPTVYNFAHIGNLRAYVAVDILRRYLEYKDFKVKHAMNITDVGHLVSDADEGEDKREVGARREGKTAWEIAEFYTKAFFEDIETLNILKAHILCKATDHIREMIELVKRLEKKGYTYIIDDGVYFDTSKLKDYGKLAHVDMKKLKTRSRVEFNPQKRNPTDFALWKFSPKDKKRHMEWSSLWGIGFPGWHIECSAMSMRYLGKTFDIHTGGVDHIPVHHTNEIAQSEAATGKKFVKYWFHNEHLIVEGKKMSKSLGNFFTLRDLLDKEYDPRAIRLILLSTHYRKKLNFTKKGMKAAENTVKKLHEFMAKIKGTKVTPKENKKIEQLIKKSEKNFEKYMDDDLDIRSSLKVVFNLVRETNKVLDKKQIGKKNLKDVYSLILKFDQILGLNLKSIEPHKMIKLGTIPKFKVPEEIEEREFEKLDKVLTKGGKIEKIVEHIIYLREYYRKKRKYEKSDEIRSKLRKRGIIIEDLPQGVTWKKS